jgi:energy-coupling factor transport system ATP-binding protein
MAHYLVLDEVVFSYAENGPSVFERLNMSVERGEFRAILGPNGSGKSTLAKLISGILRPIRGEIRIGGLSTSDPASNQFCHQRVGLVFQNPDHQIVTTSVEDEIAFGPCNLGLSPEEVRHRVTEALERFDLTNLRERPPHMLSGGEKRRLTLASVWVMRPELWVMDEPLSMLDAKARRESLAWIREIHREGGSFIYITHRLAEVMDADKISVINNGQFCWEGTPRLLLNEDCVSWGLTLPEPNRIWRELNPELNSLQTIATVEELVSAIWV